MARRPLPSREELRRFIRESPGRVGKREIARAFQITGDQRPALKKLLMELSQTGAVDKGHGRKVAPPKALPEVAVEWRVAIMKMAGMIQQIVSMAVAFVGTGMEM